MRQNKAGRKGQRVMQHHREAAAVVLAAALSAAQAAGGPLRKEIAASVNGVAISRQAVSDIVQAVADQGDDIPDPAGAARLRKQALDSLIDFELLYQESQARHLDV